MDKLKKGIDVYQTNTQKSAFSSWWFFRCKKKELQKSFKTKIRINVLSDKTIHKTKVQLRICGVR